MNNFAANTIYPTTAFGAGLVASQLLQNSPSLARLGGNCPACQGFPASSFVQPQPLLQLSLQLLEMLTNLMVGGPNALPSPQSGLQVFTSVEMLQFQSLLKALTPSVCRRSSGLSKH